MSNLTFDIYRDPASGVYTMTPHGASAPDGWVFEVETADENYLLDTANLPDGAVVV